MNPSAAFTTRRLERGTSITQAQPWQSVPVQTDSPALSVMTDLALVKAATTGPATSLRQAERQLGVVVDETDVASSFADLGQMLA